MDPNANLAEQVKLAEALVEGRHEGDSGALEESATGLAELVLALNDWMRGGGFPPDSWRRSGGA